MEDIELIGLYWSRDQQAITCTAAQYGSYCTRISMNILQNHEDADECVNDTWLHAWNAIPPDRPSLFRAWLARVCRNLSLDRYKYLKAQKRGGQAPEVLFEELEFCLPDRFTCEDALAERELLAAIERFLRGCEESRRTIFLRRYFYGDSVDAIANRMSMSVGSVKSSLFRAREALRRQLEKEGVVV